MSNLLLQHLPRAGSGGGWGINADRCTGIGVVAGFSAVVLLMAGSHVKPYSARSYSHAGEKGYDHRSTRPCVARRVMCGRTLHRHPRWDQRPTPIGPKANGTRQATLIDLCHTAVYGSILYCAVDQDDNVLAILVQSRRNKKAAKQFFRKLLRNDHG
jgi:hypothetical protein